MPRNLGEFVSPPDLPDASDPAIERIRWIEPFIDKERVSEFSEASDPRGHFGSTSSSGHQEYQDRLRAIALRKEGKEKAEIAGILDRSPKFVQTWWRKEPKEVPRPPGVHEYLKTEFWRDIEIIRGFGKGLGVYEDALQNTQWVQQMADGQDFKTGGARLKYDKEGRMRPQGNQIARDGVVPGQLPKLDAVMQSMMAQQGIDDRMLKRPGLLWYPDGTSTAIPHRHEAWTALFSFGTPRILTIDGHPVLLRDGDLIVFGTQRHGVPKMCTEAGTFEDYGGRMSVVCFFMPTGQQAQGAEPWRAIVDAPSRKMTGMIRNADLGADAQITGMQTGAKAADVSCLTDLGFSPEESVAALRAVDFNVERAAEILLGGCGPALLHGASEEPETAWSAGIGREAQISALHARLGELHRARASPRSKDAPAESDEAFALKLHMEEESSHEGCSWEERAILMQLQELESDEPTISNKEALRAQFSQYDEMLDAQDAEVWDERGDLMSRHWRRERLQIEQQEPTTLYTFGCAATKEKDFFELLSLHSIRVLYDLRANPEIGSHFAPRSLGVSCRSRGIIYKHVALGPDRAYGILKHLTEDEGRNTLAELVWHARRKRSALLGLEASWRDDHRAAIAQKLKEAGHKVLHVDAAGHPEEHPVDLELPEHLVGEEARLRSLEKKRNAGELAKPQKSLASRSSESVAQRLTMPQVEIDASAELRQATSQGELCRIQRRLANLQRRTEESADLQAGLGPKLLNVTKWVRQEAQLQRENLAAGKTKDGKEKVIPKGASASASLTVTAGAVSASSSSSSQSTIASVNQLLVDCRGCGESFAWEVLDACDGVCAPCTATMLEALVDEDPGIPGDDAPLPETAKPPGDPQMTTKPSWRSQRHRQRNGVEP